MKGEGWTPPFICCAQDTVGHLTLTAPVAIRLWETFSFLSFIFHSHSMYEISKILELNSCITVTVDKWGMTLKTLNAVFPHLYKYFTYKNHTADQKSVSQRKQLRNWESPKQGITRTYFCGIRPTV